MKADKPTQSSIKRSQYSPQFKEQAVERANCDGVPKVALDSGIAQSMLYNWVAKSHQTGQPFEDQKLQHIKPSSIFRRKEKIARVICLKRYMRNARVEVIKICRSSIVSACNKSIQSSKPKGLSIRMGSKMTPSKLSLA